MNQYQHDVFYSTILEKIIYPLTYAWNHPLVLNEIKRHVVLLKPSVSGHIYNLVNVKILTQCESLWTGVPFGLQLDNILNNIISGRDMGNGQHSIAEKDTSSSSIGGGMLKLRTCIELHAHGKCCSHSNISNESNVDRAGRDSRRSSMS